MGSSSGFQLADARLVSNPINNPQPSAIAPAQAIGILKYEEDREIFAWLKLARSLGPSLQCPCDQERLTLDQVRAIGALRHCKSDDISTWLHSARTPRAFGGPAVSASSHVHILAPTQAPYVLSEASTRSPFEMSSNNPPNHLAATQYACAQPFPTTTISSPQAEPKYCCTLCDHTRPFKNQSDWKKHEREHDTTYVCMLRGSREATLQGMQCAFCGILNPPDEHLLEQHNAGVCLKEAPDSFKTKRRDEMVNHLSKKHSVSQKSDGEAIAMKWKYTVDKQAWSCGFCGNPFLTFSDRLSHIATQHFERGQTIDAWDATKVIQGLLQQPGMIKAWKEILASLETWEVEDVIWEKDAITNLQHDLEVGPSDERSATDLAKAAYKACRMNWGL